MKQANLYAFERLNAFLNSQGYPQLGEGKFQVIRKDLAKGMQQGEISMRPDGIFCTINGRDHRGYIFNQRPDIKRFDLPKFHATDCEIVQNRSRLAGNYIWTNTETVQLYDRGSASQEPTIATLRLCSKCREILRTKVADVSTTEDFHNYLLSLYGDVDIEEPIKTDIYGYTFDFQMISRKYRASKGYICEKCTRDLSERKVRKYLHVHHMSGIKTDNRLVNLQCLCIRCHAAVDQRHTDNFDRGLIQKDLLAFNSLFPA